MHQFAINDWKLAIKSRARREFSRLLIFHNDSCVGGCINYELVLTC